MKCGERNDQLGLVIGVCIIPRISALRLYHGKYTELARICFTIFRMQPPCCAFIGVHLDAEYFSYVEHLQKKWELIAIATIELFQLDAIVRI
jgi:hypothetical protein